jgi:putative ABC transport system ATP-binding protein
MPFFRKTAPGMVISFLTSELSAVGDFLGSGLTVPAINILSLLSFIGYMFYLNPLLALLSISVYPIEIIIVPLIQKRLNRLNENRIDVTRSLSNAVGETISGMHEVHGNGSYALENRRFKKFAGVVRPAPSDEHL